MKNIEIIDGAEHVEPLELLTVHRRLISPLLVVALCFYVLVGVGAAATIDDLSGGRWSTPALVSAGLLWPVFIGAAVVRAGGK